MRDTERKPAELPIGAVFHGRYEVVRPIKEGGMGAVYEVLDYNTRRRRALKVMLPALAGDADLLERFKQEAVITADIESEHIVETFDADVDPETGSPFLVMELLKGDDIGALLDQRGRFGPSTALALLYQTGLALDRMHVAGIVHRDLKPENLFVSRTDDGPWLKVLDFGIAKVVEKVRDAKTTRTVGSPLYMSPEQIHGLGAIGARSDVYALGHIAYALLVGEAYFTEELDATPSLFAMMAKVLQGPAEPPSLRAARSQVTLCPGFDAWFGMATAADPEARFATAGALVAALAEVLGLPLPRPLARESRSPDAPSVLGRRAVVACSEPPPAVRAVPPSVPLAPGCSAASAPPPVDVATGARGALATFRRALPKPLLRSALSWVLGAALLGLAGDGAWGALRHADHGDSVASTVAPPRASPPPSAPVAQVDAVVGIAAIEPTVAMTPGGTSTDSSAPRTEPASFPSAVVAVTGGTKSIRAGGPLAARPAGWDPTEIR